MISYVLVLLWYIVNGKQTKSKWMERIKYYQPINVNTDQFESNNIISIQAFDQNFIILLEPNYYFLPDQLTITHHKNGIPTSKQHSKATMKSSHYFGKVQKFPQSKASLSFRQGFRGQIHIPELNETFSISPIKDHLEDESYNNEQHMIYKHSDIDYDDAMLNYCGHETLSHDSDKIQVKFDDISPSKSASNTKRSLLSASDLKVEVVAVLDPARVNHFKGLHGNEWEANAQASTMDIMHHVSNVYYNTDWGTTIGKIQIVLSHIVYWQDWSGSLSIYQPCHTTGCYSNYLEKFENWYLNQGNTANHYDNGVLISNYDFFSIDSFSGLAGVGVMCANNPWAQSTNINTGFGGLSDEFLAKIIAHEMGHNFFMSHDTTDCGQGYLMWPSLSSGNDGFSSCSIGYLQDLHAGNTNYGGSTSCLTDSADSPFEAICGNGVVELPETCDSDSDICCNSATCQIKTYCCGGSFDTECYVVSGFDEASIYDSVDDIYVWTECSNDKSVWKQVNTTGDSAFYIYWYPSWSYWRISNDNGDDVAFCDNADIDNCLWAVNDNGDNMYSGSLSSTLTAASGAQCPAPTVSPTSAPISNTVDDCSKTSVCIGDGEINKHLNGEYKYYQCDGSKTQFKLDSDYIAYLHWKNGTNYNRWEITSDINLDIGYAYCSKQSLYSCTANNWIVEDHESDMQIYRNDTKMTVISCDDDYAKQMQIFIPILFALCSVLAY